MRFERQKLPLTCNQRRRTLPVRITWKGDWTSGVSLHCDARVPVEVKNFQSQKIFQLFFFKTCSLHVSGLWDKFKRKKIFRISDRISDQSGIVMRFERQKLPLTFNQRRRTHPVRITWKGDWTSDRDFLSQTIFLSSGSAGFPVGS